MSVWAACWRRMIRPGRNTLVFGGRRTGKTTAAAEWIIRRARQGERRPCEYWVHSFVTWDKVIVPALTAECERQGLPYTVNRSAREFKVDDCLIVPRVFPRIDGKAVVMDEPFLSGIGQSPTLIVGTPAGNPWDTFRLPASEAGVMTKEELARMKKRMAPELYRQEFECEFLEEKSDA